MRVTRSLLRGLFVCALASCHVACDDGGSNGSSDDDSKEAGVGDDTDDDGKSDDDASDDDSSDDDGSDDDSSDDDSLDDDSSDDDSSDDDSSDDDSSDDDSSDDDGSDDDSSDDDGSDDDNSDDDSDDDTSDDDASDDDGPPPLNTCPVCNGAGEDGVWPTRTDDGYCICKTRAGYYFTTAGQFGAVLCDADGDGWVKQSARQVLESDDAQLLANARCDLRTVGTITLRTGAPADRVVELPSRIDLYETDRNDVDERLSAQWDADGLPHYHVGAKVPRAAELNSLTKYCHTAQTDYNDNGVPDVAEHSHTVLSSARAQWQPFVEFSYFAELHRGFFKQGLAGEENTYVIQEKSRLRSADGDRRIEVEFGPSENEYWRECGLQRDSGWANEPPVGMDLAAFDATEDWDGMNLHSLFKCLVVADDPSPDNPHQLTRAALAESTEYRLNECRAQGQPFPQNKNPWDPSVGCDVVQPDSLVVGNAYWGAVRYQDYNVVYDDASRVVPVPSEELPNVYARGCVNPCANPDNGCEDIPGPYDGTSDVDAGVSEVDERLFGCIWDPSDFGRMRCAEKCDGFDDDFDGVIDNGADGLPCRQRINGVLAQGDCAVGQTVCRDGAFDCVGVVPGEQIELCDGRDNNCDGIEDFAPAAGIPSQGADCSAVNPITGEQLPLDCRPGQSQCISAETYPGFQKSPRLVCISTVDEVQPEIACDNRDNNCGGDIDENRTLWEGDVPEGLTGLCDDHVDTNCDPSGIAATTVDKKDSPRRGWRVCYCNGQRVEACGLDGHTTSTCAKICADYGDSPGDCSDVAVEICGNGVDDDCDGFVDEYFDLVDAPSYQSVLNRVAAGLKDDFRDQSKWPDAELCRYPCASPGETRCAYPVVDSPVPLYDEAELASMRSPDGIALTGPAAVLNENPSVSWRLFPPWYDTFSKVLVCGSDYFWRIQEVCGLGRVGGPNGEELLPATPSGWGGNVDMKYCAPNSDGSDFVCAAESDTPGQNPGPGYAGFAAGTATYTTPEAQALPCINSACTTLEADGKRVINEPLPRDEEP